MYRELVFDKSYRWELQLICVGSEIVLIILQYLNKQLLHLFASST